MCNPSKTKVIQFSSRFFKNPILSDFLIGNARVQPSDRVCNLGVNLDRELFLSHHINETCKKAMPTIRFIGRKYLSKDQLKMMVNALLRRAWIILTVYTVAYPSEKQTSFNVFRTALHAWFQE